MGDKTKVLSCFLEYGKKLGNTDHEYMKNYVGLESVSKRIKVSLNTSVVSGAVQRVGFYMKRIGDKIGVESERRKALHWKILIFPWMARKMDVVISRVFFPTRVFNDLPLVYHVGFPPNRYVGASSLEERKESARASAKFFQKNTVATIFSTREAIHRFRRVVPETLCDKIVYLPYFLPGVEPIESEQVDCIFSDSDRIRILYVAKNGRLKGLPTFLEAVEAAVENYPNLRRKIEVTVVSKTNVGEYSFPVNHHTFLPHERVLRKMRKAHIFCLPTQYDSYGLVFIEAMASGCAVVADNSPVREEILDGGDAGLLSNPNDPDDIADKLITLIHSPEYAKKLAMRARDRFQRHYHWKPVGEKYVHLLKRAANGG